MAGGPGDPRYSTKIRAKRIALNYFKRPHPFRRWRLILSVAAPLVAAGWLLVHAGQRDQRIYNSGTVSTAHQMFETDCKVCHGPGPAPGATTLAAAGPTGYWARVTDNACTACHAGPQHHANEAFTPACASCHVEHKGRKFLVEAADQHCTQCHRDLKTKEGTTQFHKSIPTFREHPEFAVDVREPGAKPPAPGDKLLRVRLDDKAKLADNTPIKLNHARHLKANLKGIEDVVKQLGTTGIVKVKDGQQLGCTFCHRPDQRWQYMELVNYKQHCAICHELSTGIGDLVAPHDKPGLVRAFMRGSAGDAFDACQSIPKGDAGKAVRERCEGLGLAAAAPEPAAEDQPRGRRRSGGDETPATPAPEEPRPGRRRTGAMLPMPDGLRGAWPRGDGAELILVQDTPRGGRRRGEAAEEAPPADAPRGRRLRGGEEESAPTPAPGGGGGGGAAWVSQQLGGGEKKLFGTKEDGCEKCHVLNRVAGSTVPEVLTPAIPTRWLPHSRFDHSPHRPVACSECHKAATSSETKDVLLPAVSICRDCHQPKGGARSGCVECHRYHDKTKERDADGPYKVLQLLSGVGRGRSDRIR